MQAPEFYPETVSGLCDAFICSRTPAINIPGSQKRSFIQQPFKTGSETAGSAHSFCQTTSSSPSFRIILLVSPCRVSPTLAEPQPPRTTQTHLTPSHVRGRGHPCSLPATVFASSEVACDSCTCPYSTAVGKRQMTSWQILTSSESQGSCYIKVPVTRPVVKRVLDAAGQAR